MKFRIKDDDKEYLVEEINDDFIEEKEETFTDDDFVEEKEETFSDDEEIVKEEIHEDNLTSDEIGALKRLASVADKLIALINTTDEEEIEKEEEFEDAEEEIEETEVEDEEEDVKIGNEEEVIDTDIVKDSFGAIEKKKGTKDSSADDVQNEIADAWAKNYRGIK